MPTTDQRREGRLLRYELTLLLRHAGRALTAAELAESMVAQGRPLAGRPGKVVSDALRREVGHGRVVRRGRGRYAAGTIPAGTVRWMRHQLVLAGRWDR